MTGLGSLSTVQVCRDKPITRAQFEAAAKYWPTNFHEDKRLESVKVTCSSSVATFLRLEKSLRGEMFSEEEISRIETFIDAAGSNKVCHY